MKKYLKFKVERESYGIDLMEIKEVVRYQNLIKVPQMPEFAEGVLEIRGDIIPVIDLRKRLGLEKGEYNERTTIIICFVKDQEIGYIVDETEGVLIPKEEDKTPSPRFGDIQTDFLKCMIKTKEGVVMIMDLTKLFTNNELKVLKREEEIK